jgi:uncharacterized protein (TIGR03790 family)
MDVFVRNSLAVALAFVALGCSHPSAAPLSAADKKDAKRVVVVLNASSGTSRAIVDYYKKKRGIPEDHIAMITVGDQEEIAQKDFDAQILEPVKRFLSRCKDPIDFIVTTKGVPIRIKEGGYSVDAWLGAMDLKIDPIARPERDQVMRCVNPYFMKDKAFSHKEFGIYLVTRLDGFDVAACKRLVDLSLAAKPEKGPFFFDAAGNRDGAGYKMLQDALGTANDGLKKKGYQSSIDATPEFVAPAEPLAGYCSWGSNDGKYNIDTYRKLRFKPGALVETFVSTSGHTFNKIDKWWQSLIVDLIDQGVTGVKGYVSEPFTFALARPDILFDRYTSGYNLAESFSMASPILKWKDVVIGDPLCRPYRKIK